METSLEERLFRAIYQTNVQLVNHLLEKGANINHLCRGRTFLGLAAEQGDFNIFSSILDIIVDQNSNNSRKSINQNECPAHKKKKLRSDADNLNTSEMSYGDLQKSKTANERANLGYFIVVHDDKKVNNISETSIEDKTPEGMDGLEWDVEIKDTYSEEYSPESESWGSLYRWYADILDKAAEMLQVPIIADVNQQDQSGRTALHYAAMKGRVQIAQMLINAGCQIDVGANENQTPLHFACQARSLEIVNLLVQAGALVNARMFNRKTPLHLAAMRDRSDFIRVLVNHGAMIDAQDAHDRTPLSVAVMTESLDAVQTLVQFGAKVNLEDIHGYTPLCEAVWQKSRGLVKILLGAGAKITQSHGLLHSAVWHKDVVIAKLLLDAGSVPNACNNEGDPPLLIAVRSNEPELVELLLEHGANVNQPSVFGNDAVHEAVERIHNVTDFEIMLDILMKNGADINLKSCLVTDLTPMTRAMFYERHAVAAVLIRRGADLMSYDPILQQYSLCVARQRKSFLCVKLLVLAGFPIHLSTADLEHSPQNDYGLDSINGWLAYMKHNPMPLLDLCRIRIRKQCQNDLYNKIDRLNLPKILKTCLKMEDICD